MNDLDELTTADLCRLLGASRETLSNLAKRGIVVRGERRGTFLVEEVWPPSLWKAG